MASFENLRVDERVIVDAKPSPISLVPAAILLLAGVVAIFLTGGEDPGAGRILAFVVLALGLWKTAQAAANLAVIRLRVTDQRFFGESGLRNRRRVALPLSDVDSVDARRDLFGTVLGYGTLVVNAAGRANLRLTYPQIAGARRVAEQIRAQMALPTVRPTAERPAAPGPQAD